MQKSDKVVMVRVSEQSRELLVYGGILLVFLGTWALIGLTNFLTRIQELTVCEGGNSCIVKLVGDISIYAIINILFLLVLYLLFYLIVPKYRKEVPDANKKAIRKS